MQENQQDQDTKKHEQKNPEQNPPESIRDVRILTQQLTKRETFGLRDLIHGNDK